MDLLIRPMRGSDLDHVVAIAAGLPLAPQWPGLAYLEAITPEIGPQRVALVAESDRELAGFAVASVLLPESELESIAVAASFQGKGVGLALLEAILRELRRLGAEETILEVRQSNAAAIRLYRRMGFQDAGVRAGYYQSPAENALVMRFSARLF